MAKEPLKVLTESMFYVLLSLLHQERCGAEIVQYVDAVSYTHLVLCRNLCVIIRDPEVKFILDMDLSMGGNTPCTLAAGALETLHGHADRVFEGAITETLRTALDPV